MPDDTELTPAQELGQRYGCVVIDGPEGWWAQRGEEILPALLVPDEPPVLMPAASRRVLESHLMHAQIQAIHARRASIPPALSRSA